MTNWTRVNKLADIRAYRSRKLTQVAMHPEVKPGPCMRVSARTGALASSQDGSKDWRSQLRGSQAKAHLRRPSMPRMPWDE